MRAPHAVRRNFDEVVNVVASARDQASTGLDASVSVLKNMEVIMTKWILAAGLVAFATAAQAQYYGGSSYDNSGSYNNGYSSYNDGYSTSQTYGGNNDPSPNSHSAPTYRSNSYSYSYRPRTYYAPSYSGGYRSGY